MENKQMIAIAAVVVALVVIAGAAVAFMGDDDKTTTKAEDISVEISSGDEITAETIKDAGYGSAVDIIIKGTETEISQTTSADAVSKLVKNKSPFTVSTESGTSISLDGSTVAALDGSKNLVVEVSASTTVADPEFASSGAAAVVTINVTNGSTAVTALGGNATISFPYVLKSGEDADKLIIWYKEEVGDHFSYTQYPATYKDGYATFTTTHFSEYYVAFQTLSEAGFYETFSMVTPTNYSGGTEVITFTEAPERIVAGCNTALNLLLKFGLGDKIVGVYYMEEEVWDEVADEYAKVKERLGPNKILTGNIGKDVLTSWEPDLVIGWVSWNDDKGLGSNHGYWNGLGCNVMSFRTMVDDSTFDGMKTDYENFGKIFNISEETDAYMEEFSEKVTNLQGVLKNNTAKIAVYDGLSHTTAADMGSFSFYSSKSTFIGYLLKYLGANLYDEGSVQKAVLYRDSPTIDIMFFVCYGNTTFDKTLSIWQSDKVLRETPAIKNQQLNPMKLSVSYGADPSLIQVLDDLKALLEVQETLYTPNIGAIGTYVPIFGNANADLYIDEKDVQIIQDVIDGKVVWNKLTNPYVDADNNGVINQADVDLVNDIISKNDCTIKYLDYYGDVEDIKYPLIDVNIAVTYYQQAEACNILGLMDHITAASLAAAGQYTTLYPHLAELTDQQVFGSTGSSTLNEDAVNKIKANNVKLVVGTPSAANKAPAASLRTSGVNTLMLWYNGNYCYSTLMTLAILTDNVDKVENYMDYAESIIEKLESKITDEKKKSILILDSYSATEAKYSFIASENNGSFTMINKYLGNAYTDSRASEFGFIKKDIEWLLENQSKYEYIVALPTPCGFRDLGALNSEGKYVYTTGSYFSRDVYNGNIEKQLSYLEKTNAYKNGNIVVSSYDNTFGYSTYAMLPLIAAQMYPELFSLEEAMADLQRWFDEVNVAPVDVYTQGAFAYTGSNYKTSYRHVDEIPDSVYVDALKEVKLPVLGNIDGDTVIDKYDLQKLEELVAHNASAWANPLADVNHDFVIDSKDVEALNKIISGDTVTVFHLQYYDANKDGVMDYLLESTVYPLDKVIISGSANTGLLFLELGLTDRVVGAAYSGTSLDPVLYKDNLRNTEKVTKIGDSASKIEYENSATDGAAGVIKTHNVHALITDWNKSYITNYADFEKSKVDVIRLCASSTNADDATSSILLLGFLFKTDKVTYTTKSGVETRTITGIANEFAAYNAGLLNGLAGLAAGIPDSEKVTAVVSSSDGSVSSGNSDYTAVGLAAGAKYGLEGYNFGNDASKKLVDDPRILDYEFNYVIHIRTVLGYSPITDGNKTTINGYFDKFAVWEKAGEGANHQIMVNGNLPIPFRIAYTMSALYPELLSASTIDTMFQEYVDTYLKVNVDVTTLTPVLGGKASVDEVAIDYAKAVLLVYGNANEDNIIDDKDVTILNEIIAGTKNLADYPMADANMDGKIDDADLAIVDKIMKKESTEVYVLNQLTKEDYTQLVTDGVSQTDYRAVKVSYPIRNTVLINSDMTTLVSQLGAAQYVSAYISSQYEKAEAPEFGTATQLGTARSFDESKFLKLTNVQADLIKHNQNIGALIAYNATALAGYEKNLAQYKIPVLVFKITMAKQSLSAITTIGFLYGGDCEETGREYAADSLEVYNYVSSKVNTIDEKELKDTLSVCMFYYIGQTESQYVEAVELAGGKNQSTVPGTSSDKLTSTEAITAYDVDAIISYTTLGFKKLSDSDIKTLFEKDGKSTGSANAKKYLGANPAYPEKLLYVNNILPIACRVAYIAEYLYSDVFEGYGDETFQAFVDKYCGYVKEYSGGEFNVKTDCTTVVSYQDYQAAGGTVIVPMASA